MHRLENRIAALECRTNVEIPEIVVVQVGESAADALKREGHPPDTAAIYVVLVEPAKQPTIADPDY